jgi:hypothetical protein
MTQRAVDVDTAREVFIAVELAKCGAASTLIERLTGFGTRWVRRVVRENGGALARKPRDPLLWFEQRPARLLDACLFQGAYEFQPLTLPPGQPLLDTYRLYRRNASGPGLLDINECAQIVDLCRSGDARIRECIECHEPYIVLSDRMTCPVCRIIDREFCRGCGKPFIQRDHHWRAYCDECSPRATRSAARQLKADGSTVTAKQGGPPGHAVAESVAIA